MRLKLKTGDKAKYLHNKSRILKEFQEFIEHANDESQQVTAINYRSQQLSVGQYIEIKWEPNKRIISEHIKENLFEVKISENSKIKVGATFLCSQFILGQPLHIFDLNNNDQFFSCYVIGQHHGITEIHIFDGQE